MVRCQGSRKNLGLSSHRASFHLVTGVQDHDIIRRKVVLRQLAWHLLHLDTDKVNHLIKCNVVECGGVVDFIIRFKGSSVLLIVSNVAF